MTEVEMTIPFTPPSVNHYKQPCPGRKGGFYVTKEGKAFKSAVCFIANGRSISPVTNKERDRVIYRIEILLVLGPKERMDADNCLKVILDSLQGAGVIHSDARVGEIAVKKIWDDRTNGRVEIRASIV